MSSSVRQMIGLPSSGRSSTPKSGPSRSSSSKGGKRELMNLSSSWSNPSISTLAPAVRPVYKKRRATNISWKSLSIKSSARSDDLKLKHWVKIHKVPDYRFAKFNKSVRMLHYSDDEYKKYLLDGSWTRRQTDLLMDMCVQLDLRFLVIADRFNEVMREEKAEELKNSAAAALRSAVAAAASDSQQTNIPSEEQNSHNNDQRRKKRKYNVSFSFQEFDPSASNSVSDSGMEVEMGGGQSGDVGSLKRVKQEEEDSSIAASGMDIEPSAGSASSAPVTGSVVQKPETGAAATSASAPTSTPSTTQPSTSPEAVALANTAQQPPARVWPLPRRYPGEKTVEELKGRFYFIQRTLLKTRNSSDPELKHHKMFKNMYDMRHEEERKDQLAKIFKRSKHEEREMAAYVLENRRLVQHLKKLKKTTKVTAKKEAKSLKNAKKKQLPLAAGVEAASKSASSPAGASSVTDGAAAAVAEPVSSGFKPSGKLADIPESCLPKDLVKDRLTGCYLRSTSIKSNIQVTGRLAKQLDAHLHELGYKEKSAPLQIPSKKNVEAFDALRISLVTYINLSKHVSKKAQDRDQLRSSYKPRKKKKNLKDKKLKKKKK